MTTKSSAHPSTAGPGEIIRLLDQFDRAYAGDAWVGTSIREMLDSVDAAQAAAHTVAGDWGELS